jgi:RHS repeat-associated protein
VIARHDYAPFGEEITSVIGGRGGVTGYGVDEGLRQKFSGKERDSESGLDYLLARYYASAQGRFLSPDEFKGGPVFVFGGGESSGGPLPYADISDPQSLNKYVYVYDRPLIYIDPDGHKVVLTGSEDDIGEEKNRIVANASKKGEAELFKTVTDKKGTTKLILDKEKAARFECGGSDLRNLHLKRQLRICFIRDLQLTTALVLARQQLKNAET